MNFDPVKTALVLFLIQLIALLFYVYRPKITRQTPEEKQAEMAIRYQQLKTDMLSQFDKKENGRGMD